MRLRLRLGLVAFPGTDWRNCNCKSEMNKMPEINFHLPFAIVAAVAVSVAAVVSAVVEAK